MEHQLSQAAAAFVAKAWEDDTFKQRLLSNPEQVMREQGYASLLNMGGTPVTISVKETMSGKSCAHDPATNTVTFYLPERPECLKQTSFNSPLPGGMCC